MARIKLCFIILAFLVALGLSASIDDARNNTSTTSATPGQNQTTVVPLSSTNVTAKPWINTGNPNLGNVAEFNIPERTIGLAISAGGTLTAIPAGIYHEVYQVLNNTLCPARREPWCIFQLPSAHIFLSPKTKYDHISVWVERSFFQNDDIRYLMIGSIAGTVEKWHLEARNCYDQTPEPEVGKCCVPGFVGLKIYGTDNQMDVHFRFVNGKLGALPSAENQGCSNILQQAKDKLGELMPYWEKTPLKVTGMDVHCQDP